MKELIEKYLNGKADTSEQAELLAWLRVKGNKNTFNRQKQAWKKNLDSDELPFGSDQSWNRIQDHYLQNGYQNWQITKRINWYFKVAAAIFFMTSLGSLVYFYPKNQTSEVYTNVIADNGQVSKVMLPDSSYVWLNSGSELTYSNLYAIENRDIQLNGEAYFDVKRNTGLPFEVSSGEIVVQVLGTTFNVNAYPESEKIDVTLLSGKVKLNSSQSNSFEYELSPGEHASFNKESRTIKVENVNTERLVSWKEGILNVYDLSLDEVMIRLEKRYNQKFVGEEEVLDFHFTFSINDETLDEILDLMTRIAPIDVEQKGDVIEFILDEERNKKVNK